MFPVVPLALLQAAVPAPTLTRDVRVVVTDRFSRAIADVSICEPVEDECRELTTRRDRSDWTVTLPAGRAVPVRLSSPGYLPAETEIAGPDREKAIRMRSKSALAAVFLSRDAKREAFVDISLESVASENQKAISYQSLRLVLPPGQKPTELKIEDVPPGKYRLVWSGPFVAREEKAFRVVAEKAVDLGDVTVLPGLTLDGFVRDEAGAPVTGASVSFVIDRLDGQRFETKTASGGGFVLSSIPVGETLKWRVSAKGFTLAEGRWGGETRLEVILSRAQRLFGRIVDEKKEPVGKARLMSWLQLAADHRVMDGWGETSADGSFELFRTRPQPGKLFVESKGFRTLRIPIDGLAPSSSKDLDLGTLTLSTGRHLEGRVTDSGTGKPIAGSKVSSSYQVTEEKGLYSSNDASTDEQGHYELAGLPDKGTVTVTAQKESYARKTKRWEPSPDPLDFALGHGGRIEGRLCGSSQEIADSRINLTRMDPPSSGSDPAQVEPSGRFIIESVDPGTYRLSRLWWVEQRGGGGYRGLGGGESATVEVEDGRTSSVSLACDGIPVSGVVMFEGEPLPGAIGHFGKDSSHPVSSIYTDSSGRFSLHVPAAGRYEADILSGGPRLPMNATFAGPGACDVPPEGTESCVVELRPAAP